MENHAGRPQMGGLNAPENVLGTKDGLFVADTGGGAVWCCSEAGVVNGVYRELDSPVGLAYDGKWLYVAERGGGRVTRFDPKSGEREIVLRGLRGPGALALRGAWIAVAETGANAVNFYDLQNFATPIRFAERGETFGGSGRRSVPVRPSALAACDEGFWFVDAAGPALRRILNGEIDTFGGEDIFARSGSSGGHPHGLACGIIGDGCGGGRLFVADSGEGTVKAFNPESGRVLTLLEGLNRPCGLSKQGCALYIAETGAHRILRFDLSGMEASVIDFSGIPGTA